MTLNNEIKALIINIKEDFKFSIEEVGNTVSNYTYPIFQENRNKRPELIASSVAVELDGKYFLCTAKHVIDGLDKSRPTYYVNSNLSQKGTFFELNGNGVLTHDDYGIEFDLCLIDVSIIRDNLLFLNDSRIALGSEFGPKSFNVLVGYPLSKNKPTKSIDPVRNEVTTGFQTVGVKLDSKIIFSKFQGIKGNVHIGFRYHVDHKKQLLPFPRGMSGCGVWNIPSVYNIKDFCLAGIFIEYHKNEQVGFATKSNYIRQLSKHFV